MKKYADAKFYKHRVIIDGLQWGGRLLSLDASFAHKYKPVKGEKPKMSKNFATNKMKTLKKQLSTAIAFALMLTIAATFITCAPTAFGQATVKSYAFVYATPQTIGTGGTIYIVGWIQPAPRVITATYHNYSFIITKPDGTTVTQFFNTSDSAATMSFGYVCDQEGTWKVVLSWPGEGDRAGSVSPPATWIVQTDYVVPTTPNTPLPTGYWQYPISAENYEWYQISGPWLSSSAITSYNASCTNFNPYSKGPNTPHILWRDQRSLGGIIGGAEGYLAGPAPSYPQYAVAASRRIYYVKSMGSGSTLHPQLWCLNQYTGETDIRC